MHQNKGRGKKEEKRSYSSNLCKEKDGMCTLVIFYLYFCYKHLSQNNYKTNEPTKDLKITLNQLKVNDESL